MSIRIVTDSTCDLPDTVIARHNIAVIPLYINMEQGSYLDGIELSRREFYEQLPACTVPPTTAVPGSEVFARTYRQLAEEGATEILSIHVSATLSGLVDVARVGATEVTEVPITVLDSGQLSLGLGFAVQEAAHAATRGAPMHEILALVENQLRRTHVVAALATMEYLRRSGRVSDLVAGFGEFLKIKPLLKMNQGVAESERVRTERRAHERLVELLQELGQPERLALVHTNAEAKVKALWRQARSQFPGTGSPLSVNVTPVLGAHLGPGTVGFAFIAAEAEGR